MAGNAGWFAGANVRMPARRSKAKEGGNVEMLCPCSVAEACPAGQAGYGAGARCFNVGGLLSLSGKDITAENAMGRKGAQRGLECKDMSK